MDDNKSDQFFIHKNKPLPRKLLSFCTCTPAAVLCANVHSKFQHTKRRGNLPTGKELQPPRFLYDYKGGLRLVFCLYLEVLGELRDRKKRKCNEKHMAFELLAKDEHDTG